MTLDPSLLEIHTYREAGFRPLVDYDAWRVAVLNFIDELLPPNLTTMQRHDETDEVFVLLQGHCILFVAEGHDAPGPIHAVDMVPLTLYNMKCGSWHTHTLSKDASVLVIENRNTTMANSPTADLSSTQTADLMAQTERLWGPAE